MSYDQSAPCPYCQAQPGHPCTSMQGWPGQPPNGRALKHPHVHRPAVTR